MKGDPNAAAQVQSLFNAGDARHEEKAAQKGKEHKGIEERKRQEAEYHRIVKEKEHEKKSERKEERHTEQAAEAFERDFVHPDSKQAHADEREAHRKEHRKERLEARSAV